MRVSQTGSQFWLFRDLSLQDGYPQPLAALRMGANPARADEEVAQGAAASRWGLMWDPEDGPVWGSFGGFEGGQEEEEDTWTQLLGGGVSGITTDRDGERSRSLTSLLIALTVCSVSSAGTCAQESQKYLKKTNKSGFIFQWYDYQIIFHLT